MNTMKLKTKRELLSILADHIYPSLDELEKYTKQDYRILGDSDKQAVDWKTGEPKFDEEGSPIMEKEWGYVDKAEEEFTDNDLAKLAAIELLRNALEKLI